MVVNIRRGGAWASRRAAGFFKQSQSQGAAMPVIVTCPGCQKTFPIKDKYAGRKGACPHCGGPLKVPPLPIAAQETAVVGQEDDWLIGIEQDTSQPKPSRPKPSPPKPALPTPAKPTTAPLGAKSAPPKPTAPSAGPNRSTPRPTPPLPAASPKASALPPASPTASKRPAAAAQQASPAALSGLKNPLAKPPGAAAKPAPKPAAPPDDYGLGPLGGDDFLGELAGLPMAPAAATAGGAVLGKATPARSNKPRVNTKKLARNTGTLLFWGFCLATALFLSIAWLGALKGSLIMVGALYVCGIVASLCLGICNLITLVKMCQDGKWALGIFSFLCAIGMIVFPLQVMANADRWGMPWLRRAMLYSVLTCITFNLASMTALFANAAKFEAMERGSSAANDPFGAGLQAQWPPGFPNGPPPPGADGSPNWRPRPLAGNAPPQPVAPAMPSPPPPASPAYVGSQPPKTDAQRMAEALAELTSSDPATRSLAINRLDSVAPSKSLRPEMLAALTPLLDRTKLTGSTDDDLQSLVKIYANWATAAEEETLIACLTALHEQAEAGYLLEAIARFNTELGAAAISKQLDNFFRRNEASAALKSMGVVAERSTWPLLMAEEAHTRNAACEVLGEIGGAESAKRIRSIPREHLEMMDDDAVQRAIASIQGRLRDPSGSDRQGQRPAPKDRPVRGFQPAS